MTNNTGNETDTAITVFADDSIKELLKSGKIEDIQKIVQEEEPSLSVNASCFSWQAGQIVGKYEIIRRIGKGGMGVIYLARHTQLDTLRALKVLPAESAEENPAFAERFIREARIASKIRHPNVVEVMDVETDPLLKVTCIVMEYVDGGSLRQILKGQGKLNMEQAIVTVQGVAAALCTAAEHGIVHRDIKPDNIMYTKRGGVKLADLGIAKKDDEEDNLTKTNVMMGTPAYLSPEQVENPKAVDIRSDIYSLGATFYEMLTGQVPYPGKSSLDILRKIFSEPVPDPRSVDPQIPGEIASVVMKMIAKDPRKRYQTPSQVLEALGKIIPELSDTDIQQVVKSIISTGNDGTGTENANSSSVLTGTVCRLRRWERLKKTVLPAMGGCLFLGICVTAAVLLSNGKVPLKNEVAQESTIRSSAPPAVLHSLHVKTAPAATLRLIAGDGQVLTYAGSRSGEFNVSGLTAGIYELEISCQDHFTYKHKHRIPADGTLVLPLKPDVRTVTIVGIAGTKLELQYPDGRGKIFSIPASGVIKIKNLKKGSYYLKSSHPEYLLNEKRFVLANDLKLSIQMEKIFKSFSVVTLPGSQVTLLQNAQVKFSRKTNSKGENTFSKIKSGVYELMISAPHYKTHTSILHIEKDTSMTVPLEKALYSITVYGRTGTDGKLFSGTQLMKKFTVPLSGYIVINNVEQGKYRLDFSCEGHIAQSRGIELNENTSLQIDLAKRSDAKAAAADALFSNTGTVNFYLSASDELLKFIQKHGVEIKIGDGAWSREKAFPITKRIEAGEFPVSLRGKGILPYSGQSVRIAPERNTDFLMEVKPKPSKVLFSSNRSDALFTLGGSIYRADEEVLIEPFREYTVSSSARGKTVVKKFRSSCPGERLKLELFFAENIHPMQGRYEKGMALFKAKRYKEALPVLLSAAEAKHLEAVLQVALIYEKGLGMWFSDRKKALFWYHKAAEQKNVAAAVKVADAIFADDYEAPASRMVDFYLQAVEAKDPGITYKVSLIYKNGFREIKPDENKALYYLQKAADSGFPGAMYDLGIRYEKGQGVPFNSQTALFWIKKAADKGYEQAVEYWNQLKH
ncbi:MAG: protein kinase [Lentisphaeria bacterium]|nr:protein kinase [Lentisphaeria bacterium]